MLGFRGDVQIWKDVGELIRLIGLGLILHFSYVCFEHCHDVLSVALQFFVQCFPF